MKENNKKNSNKKGSENHKPRKPFHGKPPKEGDKEVAENNYMFYAASEAIAKDVASIPFNYMGGTNFETKGSVSAGGTGTSYTGTDALPSVIGLNYVNSVGVTNKKTQGVNMAAVQMYTYIRHANSGARNYEAADVMMYVLAMRDIYSEFLTLKRYLGTIGLYNYYNHNLPDLILENAGIDADDLRANLSQYRGRLNLLAKKINSFAVPKYFKVFDRAIYIASVLFNDSSSVRGQWYQFNKVGYYTWDTTSSTSGTKLKFNKQFQEYTGLNQFVPVKLSARMDVLESMIDALFLDEDALTMSGDILKAFGEGGLYSLSEIPAEYVVSYTMDEDILAQIENSRSLRVHPQIDFRGDTTEFNLDVTQNNQIITFEPSFKTTKINNSTICCRNDNYVLNSHKDDPDYRDVLEWTRLMQGYKFEGTSSDMTISLTSGGLEILFDYIISGYRNGAAFHAAIGNHISGSQISNDYETFCHLLQFDWHPILYIFGGAQSSIHIGADLKVATLVSSETMDKINDAAIYGSLYNNTLYNSTK